MKVRERVRRVDGQGCEDGIDLCVEIVVEKVILFGRQLLGIADANAVRRQLGSNLRPPDVVLATDEFVSPRAISVSWASGPEAVGRSVLRLEIVVKLGLESRDPNLEELVEVRCTDGQEPEPFEERDSTGRVLLPALAR